MSEFEDIVEHDQPAPRTAVGDGRTRSEAGPFAGNAAMSQLLGGGVDRAGKQQGAGPLDEDIASDIGQARGGGQPLPDKSRAEMEGHLGVDLSSVRVHADSNADRLSRSVQAEAFTTGTDVFFASGNYQPDSSEGRGLLAHELTHVVQQSSGQTGGEGRVSHPNDPHEVEAKAIGHAVASSAPVPSAASAATAGVAREEMEEEGLDRQAIAVSREGEEELEEGLEEA